MRKTNSHEVTSERLAYMLSIRGQQAKATPGAIGGGNHDLLRNHVEMMEVDDRPVDRLPVLTFVKECDVRDVAINQPFLNLSDFAYVLPASTAAFTASDQETILATRTSVTFSFSRSHV